MLCRYIHHVINKEHRNPYRIGKNPAGTIPPGHGQTNECWRISLAIVHEHDKRRDAGPV